MCRDIKVLNEIIRQNNVIINKIDCLHIYPIFNGILLALLGIMTVIFSLKRNIYYGISFDELYKVVCKKECNEELKKIFLALIIMPLVNYCLCEIISIFEIEVCLIVFEIFKLYYLLNDIFVTLVCDENIIKEKIHTILNDQNGNCQKGDVEIIRKIIKHKLFVEHHNYQSVLSYVGYDDKNDQYNQNCSYVFQIFSEYLSFKSIKDEKLIEDIFDDIFQDKNKKKLNIYNKYSQYIICIIYKLLINTKKQYFEKMIATKFFKVHIGRKNITYYKEYMSKLIIQLVAYSINQNNVSILYKLKKGIQINRGYYPMELIYILDSYLHNLIYYNNDIPQKLQKELKKFVYEKDEFVSWKKIVQSCKDYYDFDYDKVIQIYDIDDVSMTYIPPYNTVTSCSFDREYRLFYLINRLFICSHNAGEKIVKKILNADYLNNNEWIVYCINDYMSDIDYHRNNTKLMFKEQYNQVLFDKNVKYIQEQLSKINKKQEIKVRTEIDLDRIKNTINNKFNEFRFRENCCNGNALKKYYKDEFYLDSETYNNGSDFLEENIFFSMKNNLNTFLNDIGNENIMNKDNFINKYKYEDIEYAEDWTIKDIYEYKNSTFQNIGFDISIWGEFIFLKGFSIYIDLIRIDDSFIDESYIEDYVFEYRKEDNSYYYNGRIFCSYNDIKEYILKTNKVHKIKFQYIISIDNSNKDKLIIIRDI